MPIGFYFHILFWQLFKGSNISITMTYMHAKNVQLRIKHSKSASKFQVQSSSYITLTFYHCAYPNFDSVNACEGKIEKLNG